MQAMAATLHLRGPDALLALAERVVEQALAAGADDAEAFVQEGRHLAADIERSAVEGLSTGGDFGLGVRVLKQGRVGFGYAAEPRRAPQAIEGALRAAPRLRRLAIRFPEPRPAPTLAGPDPRIEALGPEDVAARARRVVEAAKRVSGRVELSGGSVGAAAEAWALANSRGLRHLERSAVTWASASAVLKDGTLSTGSHHETRRTDTVDLDAVGAEAARLAVESRKPQAIKEGAYTLLMKPEAMLELLELGCIRGLLADNLRRKDSPFAGKMGKQVAWKQFSLYDDGALQGGLGSAARDDEGLPSQRTPLIERGRAIQALHDLRSAAEDHATSTASAQRCGRGEGERSYLAPPRAAGRNFVVDGPRKPLAELIAETRKGLLLHDTIGAHTANPVTGDFHVNSALLFRIERGEVAGPAKSVLLSGSVPGWLRSLSGLSAEASDLGGYMTPAAHRLPWMRVEGATVHV
ncbi:MAG TPA: TldD/PmbA family protein [Candidatus Thermoplasmatota archaeon]|jgi:PmbA protein|nr:TldD/PmbA family protein [Candidatus Thermoplasmatota archaeon]